MLILKSGFTPSGLSSSPLYMAIELIEGSYLVLATLLLMMPRPGEPSETVSPPPRSRSVRDWATPPTVRLARAPAAS
ncbi:hypothetical protein D3C72_2013170 [compost metagenome]